MRDPRDCHGGTCTDCGGWFRDDEDLNETGQCESCERDEERYREEEDEHDEEPMTLSAPRTDWFSLASDIVGARR